MEKWDGRRAASALPPKGAILSASMLDRGNSVLWLIRVLAFGAVLLLARSHFTAEARERRRHEKSHRRVLSRKQGPTVRLVVDVGKPKRDRKRFER